MFRKARQSTICTPVLLRQLHSSVALLGGPTAEEQGAALNLPLELCLSHKKKHTRTHTRTHTHTQLQGTAAAPPPPKTVH